MNARRRRELYNEALQAIRFSNRSGSHVNCMRYFPNNTDLHEDVKWQVFKILRKQGHDVIVEAIFNDGGRADIVDLTTQEIYEILVSETDKQFQEKLDKYPVIFAVNKVRATEFTGEL